MMQVKIRTPEIEDLPFLFNSWLKSYRPSPAVRNVPNDVYFVNHHKLIEGIFKAPEGRVYIACNPEDHEEIYGYVVGEHITLPTNQMAAIIHWVYCKQKVRNHGIGSQLVERLIKGSDVKPVYTHYVRLVDRLMKDRDYTYNPYILWSKI